ncbi:MAG TPA: hypothetical protein VFV08_03780, partial [Puia sp.]|nr:hypothetical protein [Puia sp.]
MKRFSIYMYLAFCLLTSCSNCKSNLESPIVHVNIPKYTTTDSGAVSYAVGNTGTGDQVNSVTYSLKGGIDTTIKSPSHPFFWESAVVPGQGV